MDAYKITRTLRGVDIEGAMIGFNIENLTAKQALLEAKEKHTRWQTKEDTYRLKENFFRMLEMLTWRWQTLLPVSDRLVTVAWILQVYHCDIGHTSGLGQFMGSWNHVASSGSSTTEGASDVSLFHLFHLSLALAVCSCCLPCRAGPMNLRLHRQSHLPIRS